MPKILEDAPDKFCDYPVRVVSMLTFFLSPPLLVTFYFLPFLLNYIVRLINLIVFYFFVVSYASSFLVVRPMPAGIPSFAILRA